ncbi:MAG: multidrug effflux MFS transporter, partial [Hyphomicrobiales bacterium]|nr:multidrug effflux MFS transporter [Hyphomicrobiales bacterium]
GMAIGQIAYGPISDSTGRKPAIYAGYILFIVGCVLSIIATSFPVMLTGRFLQGVGAAGPRSVTLAMIRDQYEGRHMARVMSFIMTVFVLVPIVAPALGQVILTVGHWRAIFSMLLILALITAIWFAIRQTETLAENQRTKFSSNRIMMAVREIFASPIAFGYMLCAGLISGAFIGYLNSAQQIFQEQYGLGAQFPLYFAIIALSIGRASFLNARLVMRYGMRKLSRWSLLTLVGLSVAFSGIAFMFAGSPPLLILMTYFMMSFFCVGILFGNLNALAMEPLGHIAGTGAAAVGALSTFISVALGTFIGQSYNETVLPLIGGFAILGAIAILIMRWAESNKQAL